MYRAGPYKVAWNVAEAEALESFCGFPRALSQAGCLSVCLLPIYLVLGHVYTCTSHTACMYVHVWGGVNACSNTFSESWAGYVCLYVGVVCSNTLLSPKGKRSPEFDYRVHGLIEYYQYLSQ